ncbi:MAG: ATP-dependent helicase [Nitrospirae bacterium]|nr:ATP-dependent helicase [Nitrospirota bacterium]
MITINDIDRFNSIYGSLIIFERRVLQIISIIYERADSRNILECLKKAEIKISKGKSPLLQDLEPALRRLKEIGFIGKNLECIDFVKNEATFKAIQDNVFDKMTQAVQQIFPVQDYRYYRYHTFFHDRFVREIRIGFYTHDVEKVMKYANLGWSEDPSYFVNARVYCRICNTPFRMQWFKTLPIILQALALHEIIDDAIMNFEPIVEPLELLKTYKDLPDWKQQSTMRSLLATVLMSQGKLDEAFELIENDRSNSYAQTLLGWYYLLKGDIDGSIEEYEAALKTLQRTIHRRKVFFTDITGLFFLIAKLKKGDNEFFVTYGDMINKTPYYRYIASFMSIRSIHYCLNGKNSEAAELLSSRAISNATDCISAFFYYLASYYINPKMVKDKVSGLYTLYRKALQGGYELWAMDMANLLSHIEKGYHKLEDYVSKSQEESGSRGLVALLNLNEEPWERSLNALIGVFSIEKSTTLSAKKASRLVWLLNITEDYCGITPKEQRSLANGGWLKGKAIALKRLYGGNATGEFDCLTPQDIRICTAIERDVMYGFAPYKINWKKALREMVGHPLLFLDNPAMDKLELVNDSPKFVIEKTKDGYLLKLSPAIEGLSGDEIKLISETPTRYKIIEFTEEHRKLNNILGSKGLRVPHVAKEKVLQAIAGISSLVPIHSSMGINLENAEDVTADTQPHVRLFPFGNGLKAEILIRPFSSDGPYFKPGAGGISLVVEIAGKTLQTRRNFEEEILRARKIENACSVLSEAEGANWEWIIDDPDKCLQLLLELKEIGEDAVIDWQEGQKFRVTRQLSFDSLKLSVKRENDWFSVSGKVQLDDSTVVELKRLLELLDDGESRFVKLEEGRFIALTREFKRRLTEMKAYTESNAKGIRMHPLACVAVQEFFNSAGQFDSDDDWKEYTKRFAEIEDVRSVLPSTLQAELRDYQVEGFKWLSKLAHWGVGACLADDMGLGKTMEALAVILERSHGGPTLVIVPTSVLSNWVNEIERFAPTLNIVVFGGKERSRIVEEIKPNDVLLCTYGLLQQDEELLREVEWQSIVLDEAQAIKNFTTKRSQAAMKLKGGFKIITTGTPIENHLGELWNLFNFINPGLLGSLDRFNQRYAVPVEKYGSKDARKRLKKLIQPFILRRTKAQVLEELPSRTEIVLQVEMSPEEAAFYEALRLKALEKIENTDGAPGQKLINILAEIMRLRRACCNPRLVTEDINIPSSKLNLFTEIVDELLENKHKALVFSQFVGHLRIIREALDNKSISYQYLDGSTPMKERARSVDAFQAGEGDIFLISIKAGGFGLNLTAADYVIHMDPWWNPAVEDQASDRVHRIGQKRPVTIYKLVTRNTIEEKIVKLHHDKKELADSLLEGSDVSGKISAEELISLIKEL